MDKILYNLPFPDPDVAAFGVSFIFGSLFLYLSGSGTGTPGASTILFPLPGVAGTAGTVLVAPLDPTLL